LHPSVFDFVPAVNTSTVQDLHIDPAYGFGGLGLSILIHSMFTLYPISLISKLGYKPTGREVLVWKHSLPLVRPSQKPLTIPLGGITMDKTSSDTKKILNEYGGDITKYQGHLGLSLENGYIPLLVEVREPTEVHNSQLMFEVLLDPQRLKYATKKPSMKDDQSSSKSNTESRKNNFKKGNRRGKR
jgi:hypothetical protein